MCQLSAYFFFFVEAFRTDFAFFLLFWQNYKIWVGHTPYSQMADTRKKLVPSHESEASEDKQKLQMKTFSELAECLARIPRPF